MIEISLLVVSGVLAVLAAGAEIAQQRRAAAWLLFGGTLALVVLGGVIAEYR